jgi:radical SAM protein with 4Fe4S-binding SPASM domain
MADDNNMDTRKIVLPAFMRNRKGWGKYFELSRQRQPHLHQIEPTNACTYSCIMCPRSKKMKRKIGYMKLDLFRKVIDEVAQYNEDVKKKEIELFHFGESLLHPEIVEMNSFAVSKGLNTVLSVNAIEFTPEIAGKLIEGNAGKIIVSLDGVDQEGFKKIRGRCINYEEAVRNIECASEFVKSINSKTHLMVRMILLNMNSDKKEEFTEYWQSKGIEVEIRNFFPWGEQDMVHLGQYEKFPLAMPCPFAWQYLVVQWNGDVVACCRDYNAENIMGNAQNESLEEIWNSNKYKAFREEMVRGNFQNSICKPCLELYQSEV